MVDNLSELKMDMMIISKEENHGPGNISNYQTMKCSDINVFPTLLKVISVSVKGYFHPHNYGIVDDIRFKHPKCRTIKNKK